MQVHKKILLLPVIQRPIDSYKMLTLHISFIHLLIQGVRPSDVACSTPQRGGLPDEAFRLCKGGQ